MSLPDLTTRTTAVGFGVDCPACVLASDLFPTEPEALSAAGTHDDTTHGGRPTAEVRGAVDAERSGSCVYCGAAVYTPDPVDVEPVEWFHVDTHSAWCDPDATTVATPRAVLPHRATLAPARRWVDAPRVRPGDVVEFPYGGRDRYDVLSTPVAGSVVTVEGNPLAVVRFAVRAAGGTGPARQAQQCLTSPVWLSRTTTRNHRVGGIPGAGKSCADGGVPCPAAGTQPRSGSTTPPPEGAPR